MKPRGLALLSLLALLAGIELFARVDARVLAGTQNDGPPEWSSSFGPIPDGPFLPDALGPVRPFSNEPWTLLAAANGMICVLDVNLAASSPFQPYGAAFRGQLNLGHGVYTSSSGARQNIIYVAPGEGSDRPVMAFVPGPPHVSLGDLGHAEGSEVSGGVVVSGNLSGDATEELGHAPTGRGVPSRLNVTGLGGNDAIMVYPFGPEYTEGLTLAIGNFDGAGFDEIAVGKAGGSEGRVRIYSVRSGGLVLLVDGVPLGPGRQNGVWLTAADLNNDGADELVVSPQAGPPRAVAYTFKVAENEAPRPTPRVMFAYDFFENTRVNGMRLVSGVRDGRVYLAATTDGIVSLFVLNTQTRQVVQTVSANPFGIGLQKIDLVTYPR